MKTPLYSFPPPPSTFSQILSNPSHPPLLFFCLVSLAECVFMPHLLMYYFASWYYGHKLIASWYLITSSTYVFYTTRHQNYWRFDTNDIVLTSTLIWYHTQTKTQDTQWPKEWHRYKYILTPPVHTIATLYCTDWMTCWNKNLHERGPQCLAFSKITHFRNHTSD